ncbi:TetR/AcrR family transcriptional regulator [Eionea flava]
MTEKKRKTHQERSDLSDKLMLEAAVALILEKGTEKTTLKEVGEKAGYSRGLAGYRFGSKAGLFTFVLRALSEYWLRDLQQATMGKKGIDAIAAATLKHAQMFDNSTNNIRAFYTLWFDAVSAESDVQQVVISIHQRRQKDLMQWIIDDPSLQAFHESADDIAAQYNASLNGIAYQLMLMSSVDQNKAMVAQLHDNVIQFMRQTLSR